MLKLMGGSPSKAAGRRAYNWEKLAIRMPDQSEIDELLTVYKKTSTHERQKLYWCVLRRFAIDRKLVYTEIPNWWWLCAYILLGVDLPNLLWRKFSYSPIISAWISQRPKAVDNKIRARTDPIYVEGSCPHIPSVDEMAIRYYGLSAYERRAYDRAVVIKKALSEGRDITSGSGRAMNRLEFDKEYGVFLGISNLDSVFPVAAGRAGAKTVTRLSSVYDLLDKYMEEKHSTVDLRSLLLLFANSCSWHNSAVTGLLIACIASDDPVVNECALDILLKVAPLDVKVARDLLKELHTHVRLGRAWYYDIEMSDKRWNQLQYFDQLLNRRDDWPVDIDAEILMRAQQGPKQGVLRRHIKSGKFYVDETGYLKDFREALDRSVFNQIRVSGDKLNYEFPSLKDFWNDRLKWASGGSAPSFSFDLNIDGEVVYVKAGKKLALEVLELDDVRQVLKLADPVLWSRSAIKLEPGKQRALWNTIVEAYVIMSYICELFEPFLRYVKWAYTYTSESQRFYANQVMRGAGLKKANGVWMWDYADFNIAHSLAAQGVIYNAIGAFLNSINNRQSSRHDVSTCTTWIARAISNTYMENHRSGLKRRIRRSLMTGARGTSLINTICNGVYFELLQQTYANVYNDTLAVEWYYGAGDDVASEFETDNILLTCECGVLMNLMGYAGQANKVLQGTVEFLRESYHDEAHMGFLNRSITGLIAGEYKERFGVFYPTERVKSITDNCQLAVKRGMQPAIATEWQVILVKTVAVLKFKQGGRVHAVRPNVKRAMTISLLNGGGAFFDERAEYEIMLTDELQKNINKTLKVSIWDGTAAPKPRIGSKYLKQLRGVLHSDNYRVLTEVLELPEAEAMELADTTLSENFSARFPRGKLHEMVEEYAKLIDAHMKQHDRRATIDVTGIIQVVSH